MMIDEKFYPQLRDTRLAHHTARHRYSCRRFKFTDETSFEMGRLFGEMPEALLNNYQFALPPGDCVYSELNLLAFLEALKAPKTSDKYDDPTKDSGYLCVNGMITVISGNIGHAPMPSFHAYCIDAPPNPPAYKPAHCVRLQYEGPTDLAILALGSTFTSDYLTEEMVEDINARVSVWMELGSRKVAKFNAREAKNKLGVLKEFVGDVRNWWAQMLWINQPSHLVYDIVPRHRELTKRGPVLHQEHTLIRLKPGKTYHHLAKGFFKRAAPGGHTVRPFFRNFDKPPQGCVHDWPILPDEHGVWQCSKCTQWKVWVKEQYRGDPSRPVIRKGYVT